LHIAYGSVRGSIEEGALSGRRRWSVALSNERSSEKKPLGQLDCLLVLACLELLHHTVVQAGVNTFCVIQGLVRIFGIYCGRHC
jgi:hypothetical protein